MAAYAARGQDVTGAIALADVVALALRGLTYEVDAAGLPAAMSLLLPHAQHAADLAVARGSAHAATLLNNIGFHFKAIASYAIARDYYQRALRIDEATFGFDHPEVATDVNNLGSVARAEGDLTTARAYRERALRIDEARFGADHPKVAIRVNNLGSVAQDEGDLAAARAYLERALRYQGKASWLRAPTHSTNAPQPRIRAGCNRASRAAPFAAGAVARLGWAAVDLSQPAQAGFVLVAERFSATAVAAAVCRRGHP